MKRLQILFLYLILLNLLGFILMGMDKRRAIRHAWRIPEAHLFGCAILGGSLGSILGMYTFRHKTKHWYFVFGMPAILLIQIILGILIVRSGIV